MKNLVVLLVLALGLFALSCNPESITNNEINQSCPAPDTNCNGIPDHQEPIKSGDD